MNVSPEKGSDEPEWGSKPMFKLPRWGEPLMILIILCCAMIYTRRRGYRVFSSDRVEYGPILDEPDSARSSGDPLIYHQDEESELDNDIITTKLQSKRRNCCCFVIYTPNTSKFARNYHSRILQKFPFLIEMFYWIVTYGFYRLAHVTSQEIFSKTGIWDVSQRHGIAVLDFEESSWARFFFPIHEREVQQFFIKGHPTALTILNRAYALIHIPATVGFIAWYYYMAPSHPTFAVVRRTLTLTNYLAFFTFTIYPCMPPRLLPKEYGFVDSVRHDDAGSVWMGGNYVNALAAMPSMHFGYAFVIGCTLIYHSGAFRTILERGEQKKSLVWKCIYITVGVLYPLLILVAIVATANHYYLDVIVATFVAILAYICNRVFLLLLPIEDILLWLLRLEKPIPSTGERLRLRSSGST